MAYAVVVGEALVDLIEAECAGEPVYRPMVGGGPLNVAVGLARLGAPVEFLGAVGTDVLGARIRTLLAEEGVGTSGCLDVSVPTTLAVTSLRGTEPEFHFYGQPPSYGLYGPDRVDHAVVGGATTLYCGSIALLCADSLGAARRAWAVPGPWRVFDPNVRANLTPDLTEFASIVEEFAATADVVKLSKPDARSLFDAEPAAAALRLRAIGARAVVVTLGAAGALVAAGDTTLTVAAPTVSAVDTTGAGDATMAGLMWGLLDRGLPVDDAGWRDLVGFALTVAGLSCERPGGATAMPTLAEVRARFGQGEPSAG